MRKLLCVLFFMLSQISVATTVESTRIKSILAGKVYGNLVFLEIEQKPALLPDCQINPDYNYAFDPTTEVGKVTMSMVLTAYASQRDVYLDGYNKCDNNSAGVEELRQIWIK